VNEYYSNNSYCQLCKYKTGILSARKCNLVTCSSRLPNDACSFSFCGVGWGDGIYRWACPAYLGSSVQIQLEPLGATKAVRCLGTIFKKDIFGLFWWWFLDTQLVSLYTEPGSVKEGSVKGLQYVVPKSKVCLRNFVGPLNFCGHIIFMNFTPL
jgi:hypothetical protein